MAGETEKVRRLMQLFKKLSTLENRLNELVVAQERYVRALLVALAAKEHVALISPPGTAKSYLVKNLSRAVKGARYYQVLLNPYVTYDELFGPLNVTKLAEGVAERNWSGLVKSDIVFLDEGFKANPALLNSLLSFLNERVIYDPFTGVEIKVPLHTAVVASNEVPEEESLQALWDRIVIRVYGEYLTSIEEIKEALEAYWARKSRIENIITMDEIKELASLVEEAYKNPGMGSILALALSNKTIHSMLLLFSTFIPIYLRLHLDGVTRVSTRTLVQKLPKIWLAEVLLNISKGLPISVSLLKAAKDTALYLAENETELEEIRNKIESIVFAPRIMADIYNTLNKAIRSINSNDINEVESALNEIRRLEQKVKKISKEEVITNIGTPRALVHLIQYIAKRDIETIMKELLNKKRELEARLQAS